MTRRYLAPLLVGLLAFAACGDDDGADVRSLGGDCPSGSAAASGGSASLGSASGGSASGGSASCATSGSASASASGTETGSGITVPEAESDDPLVAQGAAEYTEYVRGQVDQLVEDVKVFTDAVRAGDVEAAKAAFAPSRQAWERIEPIAGLVETIDVAVDARVDDFENEDDPTWTGWHKIEYLLWETGDISGAGDLADQLDADIATLQETMATTDVPAAAIPVGSAELIEEVSSGKITGEEDRYSHTDLWDFAANVEGSKAAFEALQPAIEAADAELVETIEQGFADIEAALAVYAEGEGYQSFEALTPEDTTEMQTILGGLSEALAQVSGVLGLE